MTSEDKKWLKLFKYLDEQFKLIRTDFQALGGRVDAVYGLLDDRIKHDDIETTERAAMNTQLDRHDNWIHELASKTDTDLS